MSARQALGLQHTPYDGSKQPFTVGLEPIVEADWLEADDNLLADIGRKQALLSTNREAVFRAEPETLAAQQEVLALVGEHLRAHGGARYDLDADHPVPRGAKVAFGDETSPLALAAQLVQEDLVLMREGADGYRIAAACLCFPSSWSLAEKFSQSMTAIHENVPDFNSGRMGMVVGRIFQNLKVGQLLCRYNWSIYDDADLFHPSPKRISLSGDDLKVEALARLFIRVERQTLRRLPESGDILFTIRVHHDPMALLKAQSNVSELAEGLRAQLLALSNDQRDYKGLTEYQ